MSDWVYWIVAVVLLTASSYFAVREKYVTTGRYVLSMTLSAACAATAALCVLAALGVAP